MVAAAALLRVILNPGHGLGNLDPLAYDPGASSCFGKEHEIVAQVADQVFAGQSSIPVALTPTCGPDCVERHAKKFVKSEGRSVPVSHLSYVIRWINDRQQHGDYVLSLHMDAPDNGADPPEDHTGVSVYYAAGAPAVRKVEAAAVSRAVAEKLGLPNLGAKSDRISHRKHLAILEDTDTPALLIEMGFVTNPVDVDSVETCGAEAVAAAITKLREIRGAR